MVDEKGVHTEEVLQGKLSIDIVATDPRYPIFLELLQSDWVDYKFRYKRAADAYLKLKDEHQKLKAQFNHLQEQYVALDKAYLTTIKVKDEEIAKLKKLSTKGDEALDAVIDHAHKHPLKRGSGPTSGTKNSVKLPDVSPFGTEGIFRSPQDVDLPLGGPKPSSDFPDEPDLSDFDLS